MYEKQVVDLVADSRVINGRQYPHVVNVFVILSLILWLVLSDIFTYASYN